MRASALLHQSAPNIELRKEVSGRIVSISDDAREPMQVPKCGERSGELPSAAATAGRAPWRPVAATHAQRGAAWFESMAREAGCRSRADMVHWGLAPSYRNSEDERQAEVIRATDAWHADEAHPRWLDGGGVVALFLRYTWTNAEMLRREKSISSDGTAAGRLQCLTPAFEVEIAGIDCQRETNRNAVQNAVQLERISQRDGPWATTVRLQLEGQPYRRRGAQSAQLPEA